MTTPYILLIIAGIIMAAYLIHDAVADRTGFGHVMQPAVRAIKRAWLQHDIEGWQRDIEYIQSQRENDLRAEAAINREIINAKSQLRDLG